MIAEWNPVSALVQAVRELWGNATPVAADAALPLRHPIEATIVWSIGLMAIFAPLALRTYRKRTSA